MRNNRQTTIADVARAAGVSVSTVSRILNNKPDVAKKTRAQVLDVIEELNFQPHVQARVLASGKSKIIALLYPVDSRNGQPIDQLHLDFMVGAATGAGEENYFFNVITNVIDENALLKMYQSQQVDGIILMEIDLHDSRVKLLQENKYPFVMIGRCANNDGLIYLDLDLEKSVITAFDYLVGLGHQKIAYLGYDASSHERGFGPAIRGWEGFEASIRKHNLEKVYREPRYIRDDMYTTTLDLLEQEPDLSAIVTMADAPVAGVFEALRHKGYILPNDFSVIGLAIDRLANIMTPTLTAIRFPAYEMGYRAAKVLIKYLSNDEDSDIQEIIEPVLVERDSVAPVLRQER